MAVTGGVPDSADTAYGTIISDALVAEVTNPENTESVVREYFADIPAMIQVARCESTFTHHLADGSVLVGRVDNRDTGVMQINTHYHGIAMERMELDVFNLEDNMIYARHLYETQGLQPWSASRPCWGKTIAYNR